MIHQEEIISDILSRLPAKSIGRFRCVSRAWKSLLTQPHFIKTHLYRTKHLLKQEESLILVSKELYSLQLNNAHHLFDEITTFATKLCFDDYRFDRTVIHDFCSCDGLVFVCDKIGRMLLINPTTTEVKVLPRSQYALDDSSFTLYGLGYDSVSDDYKVVTVSYYDTGIEEYEDEPDCREMFVNVYSVRNGTWKKAESSPYDHAVGYLASGIFVGNCIHWLACKTSDYSSVIVAFDFGEERFREVSPHNSFDKEFVFDHLVELGGCLCMFPSSWRRETNIWVMKEYGVEESWTKVTIMDHEKSEFRPVCLLGKEQVVLVKNEEMWVDEKLVIYNLEEGTFKNVVVHGISDVFCVAGTFMESLVSPHLGY